MTVWTNDGRLLTVQAKRAIEITDPDAELTFQERKKKGQDGIGPVPQIEVYFRLADNPDLGIFKFQTGSWSLASDIVREDTERKLNDIGGKTRATIGLEEVSFVANNGPRAGQTISYTKPVLRLRANA